MTSYLFIEELFKNVLTFSEAIKGRFYTCPKFGQELNSETLDQILTETLTNTAPVKKYPLALMMPPKSRGLIKYKTEEMEVYRIDMFFLKETFAGEGANINPNTQTSQHTIPQDWHDMKRAANDFIRILDRLTRTRNGLPQTFRLNPDEKIFVPVSTVGINRASGVHVGFNVSLFTGCEIEDYQESDIPSIIIPVADSHPKHSM